jgi:hypothetical protein
MGLLTSLWDDEILERGETRRDGDELFRVKVVGSTPAGPTIVLHRISRVVFVLLLGFSEKDCFQQCTSIRLLI